MPSKRFALGSLSSMFVHQLPSKGWRCCIDHDDHIIGQGAIGPQVLPVDIHGGIDVDITAMEQEHSSHRYVMPSGTRVGRWLLDDVAGKALACLRAQLAAVWRQPCCQLVI